MKWVRVPSKFPWSFKSLWDSQHLQVRVVVVTRETFYLHFLLFLWSISKKERDTNGARNWSMKERKKQRAPNIFPFGLWSAFVFSYNWDKKICYTSSSLDMKLGMNCRLSLVTCHQKLTFSHSKQNSEYKRL